MVTPRLLSDRYELGDTLGKGSMAEVHLCLDKRLSRDVAVKVLRADLARDPQFQLRFRREAQNAAMLNHPAIVAVLDTGEVQSDFGPLPYIVMEYVDGHNLREIVKTQGPMSQQRVIEVMADVCAALDFSHKHNIIHRDVKPANIMINRAGAVKVMDFGIARALGEEQNGPRAAAVIGNSQYLSPEQARGEPVDVRSDVYAAGCVLFEMLTREPLFAGKTAAEVRHQHVHTKPRSPRELNSEITPGLNAVVLKALSKSPDNRYQSAADLRDDLIRVRSGERPQALPAVYDSDEVLIFNPSLARATGIFVSYRREIDAHFVGRLSERLSSVTELLVDMSIPPGANFVQWMQQELARCSALLVVIGPYWARITDRNGRLRLHNPHDFVRMEIEAALHRHITVIPILINDARMPHPAELPPSLIGLLHWNAIAVSAERFHADVDRLTEELERLLPG